MFVLKSGNRRRLVALSVVLGVALAAGGLLLPHTSSHDESLRITVPDTSYRPAVGAFSGAAPGAAPLNTAAPAGAANQVVALVNKARVSAGCRPLGVDPRLVTAAQAHSDDMADRAYFAHTTPDGVPFDQRIEQAGYPRPAAENIARGSTTADQTMDLWMKSPGHRQNILNCAFQRIGVGVDPEGWYWTQNFGY